MKVWCDRFTCHCLYLPAKHEYSHRTTFILYFRPINSKSLTDFILPTLLQILPVRITREDEEVCNFVGRLSLQYITMFPLEFKSKEIILYCKQYNFNQKQKRHQYLGLSPHQSKKQTKNVVILVRHGQPTAQVAVWPGKSKHDKLADRWFPFSRAKPNNCQLSKLATVSKILLCRQAMRG